MPTAGDVAQALRTVQEAGYVTLKLKSYHAAQERLRKAKCDVEWAKDETRMAEAWARESIAEERRIRERLEFVYGVARAHGATVEELGGCANHRLDLPPVG